MPNLLNVLKRINTPKLLQNKRLQDKLYLLPDSHLLRNVRTMKLTAGVLAALALIVAMPATAHAVQAGLGLAQVDAEAVAETLTISTDTAFILNTFMFLVFGALVMWMAAGFTMLEAGSVRSKNASMICLKNIGIYSVAGIAYYVLGYNLMYNGADVNGWIGTFDLFYDTSAAEVAMLSSGSDAEVAEATTTVVDSAYATMSDWFFQMVFVATAASIVSGAIAERAKMWTFFMFTLLLTMFIYPIVGAWTWGGGWLAGRGFSDFAGSTIVHGTGGWAALAGLLVVGPRRGKYRRDGTVRATPPSNVLMVTLGVFILWLGWFGFNGGSVLELGSVSAVVNMSNVIVNTNLAAAAGTIAALALSRALFNRLDLVAGLNGAIAGLVAITAGPDFAAAHWWAILIGAVGGVICTGGMKLLEMVKIDDVVGAVPAHLFAGIWGTIAVVFTNDDAKIVEQLIGVISVGVFVFSVSLVAWKVMDMLVGVRVTPVVERVGQDSGELGIQTYPEFVRVPEEEDDEADTQDSAKTATKGRKKAKTSAK